MALEMVLFVAVLLVNFLPIRFKSFSVDGTEMVLRWDSFIALLLVVR